MLGVLFDFAQDMLCGRHDFSDVVIVSEFTILVLQASRGGAEDAEEIVFDRNCSELSGTLALWNTGLQFHRASASVVNTPSQETQKSQDTFGWALGARYQFGTKKSQQKMLLLFLVVLCIRRRFLA